MSDAKGVDSCVWIEVMFYCSKDVPITIRRRVMPKGPMEKIIPKMENTFSLSFWHNPAIPSPVAVRHPSIVPNRISPRITAAGDSSSIPTGVGASIAPAKPISTNISRAV